MPVILKFQEKSLWPKKAQLKFTELHLNNCSLDKCDLGGFVWFKTPSAKYFTQTHSWLIKC